jgi:predicted nucleic acid-binding protein
MKVADTSYLVEGILRDASIFENETLIAPDIALYEFANTLWKHEALIGDLKDAPTRLAAFLDLVSSQVIELVRPDRKLMNQTLELSKRHHAPIYDTVFAALALQLRLDLKTFDKKQLEILSKEKQSRN